LVAAGVLAGLGYLCLWTCSRAEARGMKLFGKVLGIVLLCIAGLALLAHLVVMPGRMMGPCGAGIIPGRGPDAAGCAGKRGPGQVRIEKRVCSVDEDDEEELVGDMFPGLFEDFIAESPEFEARVRKIVTEMQAQQK
jgi:hypothetical protein